MWTEHKGQERRGRGSGVWRQECQARIQGTWALLPDPATNSLGVLEQDHPEGRIGGPRTGPRPCVGEDELQNLVHAFGRLWWVFNQKHFPLKTHLAAFKCLAYLLTSKGTKLRCQGDISKKRVLLLPKCPVLCLAWEANRQGQRAQLSLSHGGPAIVFTSTSCSYPGGLL